MEVFLEHYWPHILAAISFILGATAAIHAAMTKDEVRAAIGWVGIIMLSPILGAAIYAVAGINRMRRASVREKRMRFRIRSPTKSRAIRSDAVKLSITLVRAWPLCGRWGKP